MSVSTLLRCRTHKGNIQEHIFMKMKLDHFNFFFNVICFNLGFFLSWVRNISLDKVLGKWWLTKLHRNNYLFAKIL